MLVGAAVLWAAESGKHGPTARLTATAEGSISISNSKDGTAIFRLPNLAPGVWGEGEVTIGNSGSTPGSLALEAVELSDAPGVYGGALSERLDLGIFDLGSPGSVYSGAIDAMPRLALGVLEPGEAESYRFTVRMLDGGAPSSPYADDNTYQRASASLGYRWTLTEVEPGAEEEIETGVTLGATQAPAPSSPPLKKPRNRHRLIGTPRPDRMIGTDARDRIFGRGGPDVILGAGAGDYLVGRGGADRIQGGGGNDRIRGGPGHDLLIGGAGSDLIYARDGEPDTVDCGSGHDAAYVDQLDETRGCENVARQYGRVLPGAHAAGRWHP
jgi:hypothetical protein